MTPLEIKLLKETLRVSSNDRYANTTKMDSFITSTPRVGGGG